MTAVPPIEAFTAIVFDHGADDSKGSNSDLTEPLLIVSNDAVVNKAESTDIPFSTMRLKILSFITGCIAAFGSELVLTSYMWNDSVLYQGTKDIVIFSIVWSFWTCNIIFGAMMLFLQIISKLYQQQLSCVAWQDLAFQVEAHHIVGALLSISFSWMIERVLNVDITPFTNSIPSITSLVIIIVAYIMLFSFMTKKSQRASPEQDGRNLMSTYLLVAATLGLIIGLCSQFILSFCLWRNTASHPTFSNFCVLSVVWSLSTVVITFTGCATLRSLTADETDRKTAERIFLRMEAHYVFCSMIGICMSWIFMDMVLNIHDQIVPSLVILMASLSIFALIVKCFPEEECLAEIMAEDSTALVEV